MKCRRSGSGDDLQVQGEEKVLPEPSESQNRNRGLEMDLQQELEPNYSTAGRKIPHLLSYSSFSCWGFLLVKSS